MAVARVFNSVIRPGAMVVLLTTFAVLAEGQTCPGTTPNPCYNANGTTFVCCSAGCGPSAAVATCASAEPVPDLSVYVLLDLSKPYANCENQQAAPGAGVDFGDVCLLNVPLMDAEKKEVVGSAVIQLTVWQPYDPVTGNYYEIGPATYFFGPSDDGNTDSIHIYGILLNSYSELTILGGTGKYRGARGYAISDAGDCNADGSICYYPKNIYLT
ncbi:hypothetical protein KFL_001480260 [Klebsormidium nitens]|uniref:Dirigent protein n=1 Tax=Klebsormidium nitens TaxID=105231 RepID=A0A1Y1I3Y6_KLENI|nr:hypothetical protein KFL_001480260 [Klebsormidium nitens]|eukprot:GAQ83457.1 hypothetical protein KFL_001480260 [Klebsormidium nitens]